ncbi:uncharacterized protein [Cicer arietinum]|uniref:Uncharacterized protein DDB_G0271670-like n=1 Tax=Cicer arietinum TaxID=3827 RepID=A0A1S2YD61_CICAR|nr:uncharacterized protein DDB_G0271670-like [Cicer arietinum]
MEQIKNNPMFEAQKKRSFHDEYDVVGSFFSSSSSSDSELSNGSSLESDSFEEVTSPTSSSSSSSTDQLVADPLNDMSSLFQQLPMKRGLSKFYQGKSQSFTSLTNVKSLEDLVKPESPYNKKLKSCKSYGEGFCERQDFSKCNFKSTSAMSRLVSKRGSCSSLSRRRGSGSNFMSSRPPIPPHRSSSSSTNNMSNQTALFA